MTLDQFKHYRTGIYEIDEGNWNIISEVQDVIKTHRSLDLTKIKEKLNRISLMFSIQLALEEETMRKKNYQFTHCHIKDHNLLFNKINKITSDLEKPNAVYSNFVVSQFLHRYVDHIDAADVQFGKSVL